MFSNRVGCRPYLTQQPRRRCRMQQITLATLQHIGQYSTRRVYVTHDVDTPDSLPVGVADPLAAYGKNAGIGTKQINRSKLAHRLRHQVLNIRLNTDINTE